MRLKQVKIAGFKSFVEPTRLVLPSELVGIVGPNGCGKSNTLDAVRWVMGESSAKELRGGEMNDVLFNGTDSRKAVSQCSVELVFDNEQGLLAGAFAAYAEISVKRVHHRDEGTQYFLNQRRCRRRDVVDLFNGTGLGARSYALIGQGNISRIIEAKPEDMRVYLEEVAGIGVYRSRRKETLVRLERVRDNLAQLRVLQGALLEQASHLALQAEKARDYQQTQARLQQLEQRVFYHQWQDWHQQAEQAQALLRDAEKGFARSKHHWDEAQKAFLLQRQALVPCLAAREQTQARFHALDKQWTSLQQQQALLGRQRAQWQHQQALNQQQLTALAQAQQQQQSALEEAQLQLESLDEHIATVEEALAEVEQAGLALSQEKTQAQQQLQQAQWQFERVSQQQHQAQATLASVREQISHLQQEGQALAETVAGFDDASILQQQAELDTELVEITEALLACESHTQQAQQALEQAQQAQQTQQAHWQSVWQARQALAAQVQGLQRIEQTMQENGDAASTESMSIAHQTLLATLAVEAEWQQAVELWLGDYLQGWLLAAPWPEAESLPSVSLLAWNPPSFTAAQGSLAQKIHAPSLVRHWANRLYCRDEALPLAQQLAQLDDQAWLIDRQGRRFSKYAIAPGGASAWSGSLARQAHLQDLIETLAQHDATLREAEQALQQSKTQLEQAQSQYQACLNQGQQAKQQQQSARARLAHLSEARQHAEQLQRTYLQTQQTRGARLDHLQSQEQQQTQALEALEHALVEAENQLESQQAQVDEIIQRMVPLQAQRERLTVQYQRVSQQRQQCAQALSQHQFALAQYDQQAHQLHQQAAMLNQHALVAEEVDEATLAATRLAFEQAQDAMQQAQQLWQNEQTRLDQLQQAAEGAQQQHLLAEQALVKAQLAMQALQQQREQLQKTSAAQGWSLAQLSQMRLESEPLAELEAELKRLKLHLSRLGAVNMTAIEAFQEVEQKLHQLNQQIDDLTASVDTLEQAIATIDQDSRQRLTQTFNEVNQAFKQLFPQLFQGGEAGLFWQNSQQDPLEGGIEVMARPPGKRNARIQLLSGGEKTLAALALIFAIFELKPAPFCILDEVDAPLDDSNVIRFCGLVRSLSEKVQFIFITHNKTTMAMAKHLIGVTMYEAGVSRLVSVDLEAAVEMIGETGL
jgi:chromosome segregation protein